MDDAERRSLKRRRLDISHDAASIDIGSSKQLQNLLQFRQSINPETKSSVNLFKDFLSQISKTENLAYQAKQLRILRQYCESQTAASEDDLSFSDLISTWSFAVQSNNDSICSAVPAALAQFYKTISGILEFRDFGFQLGLSLLKPEQLRLFDRGLSASKGRDHLISPCLRLLVELVSFDAGILASRVFDRRDIVFKRLDSLLDQRNVENHGDRRKPTVRRMALRLLIANLKFLDGNAKAEFITHGRILRNCLQALPNDGDDIVLDMLKSLEVGVVADKEIPKSVKSRIFNQDNLTALAELYNYEVDPNHLDSSSKIRNTAHELLIQICTTRNGVLISQNGWYPVAFDTKFGVAANDDCINLGLDSPSHVDEFNENIPIKNAILSKFSQSLKPGSDTLQSMLLVQIFRSAPELVADYFSKQPKSTSILSEDPAWRGQFAFVFSVVQLPIPKNFGWQEDAMPNPPPVNIVLENIIPRVLDRTILSKYFTSNDEILVLSVARLLITVLEKLSNVLEQFQKRNESAEWQQAFGKLVGAILQRVPKLPEIIESMQKIGRESGDVRSVVYECLAVYHRLLPETTVGSKFDISPTLLSVVAQLNLDNVNADAKENLRQQVLQLIIIADLSQATKWWHKPDTETMSLFSEMFKFAVNCAEDDASSKVLSILKSVSGSAGFLGSGELSFTALQLSIARTKKFEASNETWLLLGNAVNHAIQHPVRYIDHIEDIQRLVSDKRPLSLLAATAAEQWNYASKKYEGHKDTLENIAEWIVRLYGAFDSAGENNAVMQQLQDDMLQLSQGKPKEILKKAIDRGRKELVMVDAVAVDPTRQVGNSKPEPWARTLDLNEILGNLTVRPTSLEGIDRWDSKTDIELAIHSDKVAKLLHCTASPEEEVRRQAFQHLQRLVYIIEQSVYDEKVQVHLLIAETVETVRELGFEKPLPSAAAQLSICLLRIVSNPSHLMYGKANRFLLRSPSWDLKRFIPFWIRQVLYEEPENDDAGSWTNEVEWLLQWLISGLQTNADMELYRRSGVFEKILSIYTKPSLLRSIRKLILRLIWHAVQVDGTNTLITRMGVLGWLYSAEIIDKEHQQVIRQLHQDICARSDIEEWINNVPILRNRRE